MSYFDKIYAETVKYRDKFQVISSSLDALNVEKVKQAEMVTYSRRRRFIIANSVDPIIEYLKQELKKDHRTDDSEMELLKAQAAIKRRTAEDEYRVTVKAIEVNIEAANMELRALNHAIDIYDNGEIEEFDVIWKNLSSRYDMQGLKDQYYGYKNRNNLNELTDKRETITRLLLKNKNDLEEVNREYMNKRRNITEELRGRRKQFRTQTDNSIKKIQLKPNEIKSVINKAEMIKGSILGAGSKATDLEKRAPEINNLIRSLNNEINKLDLNVTKVPELPETVNDSVVRGIYNRIKSEINQVKSLYPQSKFENSMRVIRMISHDISENRGHQAFTNRKMALVQETNQALSYFNSHTWQVSGKRWERISGHSHGFKKVAATHSPVSLIA